MNSQATSPGASSTMRSAQAPHCSSCGKPATTTASRSATGSSRTRAEVTIASVPSLPRDERAQVARVGVLEPGDRAVAEHDLDAEHVVGRDAVAEAVQPAGVRRDVAADHGRGARRRIGRVAQSVEASLTVECSVR